MIGCNRAGSVIIGLAYVGMWALLFLVTDRPSANAQALCSPNNITFCVNETVDDSDALAGDGLCATASHKCTLRAAVQEATALGTPRRIVLLAPSYRLDGELEIPSPAVVTIVGNRPNGPLGMTTLEPSPAAAQAG